MCPLLLVFCHFRVVSCSLIMGYCAYIIYLYKMELVTVFGPILMPILYGLYDEAHQDLKILTGWNF